MNIFECQAYKKFVNDWIKSQPKEGRGQLKKMSEYLRVSSVIMSQVFRGDRDLSLEQAAGLAQFMGLRESETQYFIAMVGQARAGSKDLIEIYQRQLDELRTKAHFLKNRIRHQAFSKEDQAKFYSEWYYSAIRLGVSIEGLGSIGSLAGYLNLDRRLVAKALEFLLKSGLVKEKGGQLELGPKVTHVGHDSPFVNRHHTNWRILGLQKMVPAVKQDFYYTGPMALSEHAAQEIRESLLALIESATKKAAGSNSETLRCLTIDWFGLEKQSFHSPNSIIS